MAMKVVVSACLMGVNCKYSGGNNDSPLVREFLKDKDVIPVCPETASGLPSPRPPVEIRRGRVIRQDGEDVTELYSLGTRRVMEKLRDKKVDLAILKARSPTCGVHAVYDGTFSHRLVPGSGLFAALLKRAGVPVIDEEELEKRLKKEKSLFPLEEKNESLK